jgi:hypothetical protein
MRQERASVTDCPNPDNLPVKQALYAGLCVEETGYFLKPERHSSLFIKKDLINRPGAETVYLKSRVSQSNVRKQLRALEDRVWFSPYTSKIEVLFTLYNAHLDIFSATYLVIVMNRGGHMYKMVEPISTQLTLYRHPLSYVVDILLAMLMFKIVVDEGREIRRAVKVEGFRAGMRSYIGPANAVDWIGVFYFVFLLFFWFGHVRIVGALRDALAAADINTPGSFTTDGDRDDYYDAVDDWVRSDTGLRVVLAIFPFIIGFRFFKVFSLQPRLGVVTATLRDATLDIAHFFVVFASIFMVFVTSGMLLFGQEMADFANFGRSLNTVFRIMMGDFDWAAMSVVGRQQAGFWFWGFTWLVNLIMLNMLLAIVMDVYTQVKGRIPGDAETMWSQVAEIVHRWGEIRSGRQIRLESILDALERHHPEGDDLEEERITTERFMTIVPGIPEHQAVRLLISTYANDEEESAGRGGSMSETSSRVQHIFKNTTILQNSMERLIHMQELTADMMSTNFAEMRFHHHAHKHKENLNLSGKGPPLEGTPNIVSDPVSPTMRI